MEAEVGEVMVEEAVVEDVVVVVMEEVEEAVVGEAVKRLDMVS
jgi:hypothetical protein